MSDVGLDLVLDIARAAATLARDLRAEGVAVSATKTSAVDIVTAADRATEELIRSRVLEARPDDGFLGEEGTALTGTSGVRWIVDPIDGTVNYLYGLPVYAVSIAVAVDDEVVTGVVVNPAAGEEYAATRGGGATLNGQRIGVREQVALSQSLVATGFSYEQQVRTLQAEGIARMLPQVRDIRRAGSCALDLCSVAAGRIDAYVEEGTHLWDRAAGGLVAEEAGATVAVETGASGRDLLMCAPAAGFAVFRDLVRGCGL